MISFLLDTLLATGALIALVLLLRKPVGRAFGPQLAYALWLLPLLRLVMPPILLPASLAPHAAAVVFEPAAAPMTEVAVAAMPTAVTQDLGPMAAAEPSMFADIPWGEIVLALWLCGALLFLAWRVITYRRMREDLLAGARPVGEVGRIRLVETPGVFSPVAFGVIDKIVALPPMFMALEDRSARDLAIAHELAHHKGRDISANFLAQPLFALHWFNPLAWLAWRAMRRDQEAACDARVMAARSPVERVRYAEVIASFAAGPRLALAAPMACPMVGEKSIVHRLRSLNMDEVSPRRRLLGRALMIAGALALPLTATVSYAASGQPEAPEPPEAPDAPEAPEAPQPPETVAQHRIVIVDTDGEDREEAKLHTRTVTKDGRTIVLKTDRPLSDAEADARIERALNTRVHVAAVPPVPPVPPVPATPNVSFAWNADHEIEFDKDYEKNMEAWGKKMEKWGEEYGERMAKQAEAQARIAARSAPQVVHSCEGDPKTVTRNEVTSDGRQRIIICERVARRQALGGLRSARNTIASDRQIDPDVRNDVLDELDSEIERIESEG